MTKKNKTDFPCLKSLILLGFFLFLLLGIQAISGCATGKSKSRPQNVSKDKNASRQEISPSLSAKTSVTTAEEKAMIKLEQGKTILFIPGQENGQIQADYIDKVLEIKFTPPISTLKTELKPKGLVKKIKPIYKFGHTEKLKIFLNQDAQFLISKDTPTRYKVLLAPKKMQTSKQKIQKEKEIPTAKIKQNEKILQDIEFFLDGQNSLHISLKTSQKLDYNPLGTKNNKLKFLFPKLKIPSRLSKLYNLSKFNGPAQKVLLENSSKGAILTMDCNSMQPLSIQQTSQGLEFIFTDWLAQKNKTEKALKLKVDQVKEDPGKTNKNSEQSEDAAASETAEATLYPGMKKEYTGRIISLDFQDADIEHVLRLIAEISGYNLILDESVSGNISLKLESVPWDQALDLILLQKGLGMKKRGNILRIAPAKKLQEEQQRILKAQKAEMEAKQSKQELAPLHTEYIQINYTTAAQIKPQVDPFVSKRGSITFDTRTNQLIVSATRANLKKIKSAIHKLDRPERQVLIEARLVYATDSFQKSLGLKWGGGYLFKSEYHGDSFEQGFYGTTGDVASSSDILDDSGLAVNLPNQGSTTLGIGAFISKLTGSDLYTLDAQLQIGESKGQVKTISSPRLVTLNNQRAEIVQGTKIATKSESESGGTTTEYTDATLRLSVMPQITPDNKLILELDISDDSPVPGGEDIETRSTQTKLIVDNGETLVIGGVQQVTENTNQNRVPGLADTPLFGWLFKNRYRSTEKRELLIFIQPKILP